MKYCQFKGHWLSVKIHYYYSLAGLGRIELLCILNLFIPCSLVLCLTFSQYTETLLSLCHVHFHHCESVHDKICMPIHWLTFLHIEHMHFLTCFSPVFSNERATAETVKKNSNAQDVLSGLLKLTHFPLLSVSLLYRSFLFSCFPSSLSSS